MGGKWFKGVRPQCIGRTFEEAIAYFVAQQEMEARYREAILSRDSSVEEKNRLLSAIGLETIPTAGD